MDSNAIKKELEIKIPEKNIYINESMKKHTSFKIGGNADIYVKIKTIEELEFLLNVINKNKIQITILGNGSNILVKDKGIRGIVCKIGMDEYKILKDNEVIVEAGLLNSKLSKVLLDNELSGFEFANGIPGTIGGAIKQNAGAFGSEMKDIIKEVTYIDLKDNKIKTLSNKECKFKYRNSIFFELNTIIVRAILKFEKKDRSEIYDKMNKNIESRKEKQPIDMPSAGSTFKRGNDFITAKLIDECGLKGYSIGDAMISDKHAGFIVNKGEAKAKDVIELINYVKETVKEKKEKNIELEIEIIGE